MAEISSTKGSEFFILNKKLQTLNEKLDKERAYGKKINNKIMFNDRMSEMLLKKLRIMRMTMAGACFENDIDEELNKSYSEESSFVDTDMPPSLEKLATEVKEFIGSMKPLPDLCKSFTNFNLLLNHEDKSNLDNSNYSDYSDFVEETGNEIIKLKNEKMLSELNKIKVCQIGRAHV